MGLQHENWTQNPVSKHNSGETESSTQSPSLFLEEDLFGAKSGWRWFRLPSHPVVARPLFLAAAAGASSPSPSLRGLTPLSQSLATPVAVGRRESASERERTFQFGGFPPQREREKGFRMMPCPYVDYIVFWSKVHVFDLKVLEGP